MPAPLPWPIQEIGSWPPVGQGLALFVSTFVLEDAAVVAAGLLLAAHAIAWPVAFAASFIGIWTGDVGLYLIARFGGRPWLDRSFLRRFTTRVEASEKWFRDRGTPILVLSRLIPGTRLPMYLAAGFLRVPFARFVWVTGLASFFWTAALLWLVQSIGAPLLDYLATLKRGGWALLASLGLLWGIFFLIRRGLRRVNLERLSARLGRWRYWEFWPTWLFYPPVALYCLWLAVKHRGLAMPTAANPGMLAGGMLGESKMETLKALMDTSPEFTADAELLAGSTPDERLDSIRQILARTKIQYPFILKPDVGQRGVGVKLIRTEAQARDYLNQTPAPLLMQRFAEGPHEVGVFYYRFPEEPHGRIFAITEKEFPALTGDGQSTIEDLVWRDERARFMADTYLRRLGARRKEIPAEGETIHLVVAGNHAQGCIFRDGMHLCTPALAKRIDSISLCLPGFYVGRYDLRFSSVEDLQAGKDFQIIELNGASSEATSIYDPRNSVFAAYKTLFAQWDLVFAIGAANHRRGHPVTGILSFWRLLRSYARQSESYPAAD